MSPPRDLAVRRRMHREAVFNDRLPSAEDDDRLPARAIEGVIADASPHVLVLTLPDGPQVRLPMSASASIWYDGRADLAALRPGRHATVRPARSGGLIAERVWVDIARVTGVIADRAGNVLTIDSGPHRGHMEVTIPDRAMRKVRVRHPRLEPGALFDVIGIRRDGRILGVQPPRSSPQPAPHAVPAPPGGRSGRMPRVFRGTATWYDHPGDVRGAAYPALDPRGNGGGCGTGPAATLPYLSVGSEVHVRNECTGQSAPVPIVECGCLAARFCDRCVHCGTSPRGRIVELTRRAFVDLGGDLDAGCFNVTIRVGRP